MLRTSRRFVKEAQIFFWISVDDSSVRRRRAITVKGALFFLGEIFIGFKRASPFNSHAIRTVSAVGHRLAAFADGSSRLIDGDGIVGKIALISLI